MCDGANVLILEDEPITALDLRLTVEAAGGIVVGPAATLAAALELLDAHEVSAAILDANLPDGDVTPVALLLIERGIPVIVHTGKGLPDELERRYPHVPVHMKPTSSDRVIEALSKMIREMREGSGISVKAAGAGSS